MACLTFTEFEKKLAEKELACNSNEMCSGGKQVEIILDSLDFYKYFSGYNKLFGYNNFCNNFAEIDKNMDITSFPYFIPAFSFVIKQLPCEFDISGFLKVQRRSVIQPDTFYSSKFD